MLSQESVALLELATNTVNLQNTFINTFFTRLQSSLACNGWCGDQLTKSWSTSEEHQPCPGTLRRMRESLVQVPMMQAQESSRIVCRVWLGLMMAGCGLLHHRQSGPLQLLQPGGLRIYPPLRLDPHGHGANKQRCAECQLGYLSFHTRPKNCPTLLMNVICFQF